jgi:hypothetical protein
MGGLGTSAAIDKGPRHSTLNKCISSWRMMHALMLPRAGSALTAGTAGAKEVVEECLAEAVAA